MYDLNTNFTVENPINRYTLGSDNDLKKNDDGSITIYLQKDSPGKDKGAQLAACASRSVLPWRCGTTRPPRRRSMHSGSDEGETSAEGRACQ